MSWNKKSIASNAPVEQIAQKFGFKNTVGRSPHMRAKQAPDGQIVIFSKHFDATKFRAILGDKEARLEISEQRKRFRHTIANKVDSQYGTNIANNIGLNRHPSLRGTQIEAMQAHAAVAAATAKMGLDRYKMNESEKQSVCQLARDHVYGMKSDATASNRIFEAQVFIIQTLVENRLTAHFKDQTAELLNTKITELRDLCKKLESSPLAMNSNMDVMAGLVSLLTSNEAPTIDNLQRLVTASRNNRRDSANQALR